MAKPSIADLTTSPPPPAPPADPATAPPAATEQPPAAAPADQTAAAPSAPAAADKPAAAPAAAPVALAKVRLKSVYSGFRSDDGSIIDPGPGQIISVPAEEAMRLVELGAAELVAD